MSVKDTDTEAVERALGEYTHHALYVALRDARANFPPIVHNKENPHFHSTYADLSAILEAVTVPLENEGLLVVQTVEFGYLHTELIHVETGTFIGSDYPLPSDATPQQLGSALTYARRYALSALLNLVTEKDDDGNAASSPKRPEAGKAASPAPLPVPKGWDSTEQAQLAHMALVERIGKLGEQYQAEVRAFRDEHGWPLSQEKFNELESVVRAAEGF